MTIRRVLSALLMTAMLGLAGSMTASVASAAPGQGSANPNTATVDVGVLGEHFVRSCVHHFKANSTVTLTNQLTGKSVTIKTNSAGSGCAEVPIKRACQSVTQVVLAQGTGVNGKAQTTRATITAPPTKSLCASNNGSTLPFTGANIIIPVVAGLLLLVIGAAITITTRRRRTTV